MTAYTPLTESAQHTADIGTNAAAIAALQGQVAALPAAPDLTPYALASDLAAAEGLIAANASGLTAVNTSLTLGLASKANQSALDALQVQVDGKSTPASVDLKLANHPTIAAMNSSIASTNNATLATVATTYALKTVVDQLAIDVAARQTAADVDQRVATALLSYLTQTAYQAGQALQDARLDGHDTEILALQNAGPFATAGDLSNLQVTLQSAIDGILAEIATLGGATNLVNAPAWLGNVTWDLLAGTNQIRNLHATGPLSIQLANDDWTLSFGCDAYTTLETDQVIAAALTNYFTRAEVTVTVVAAIDESKAYTDTQLADYSTTTQMNQAISDALVPFETAAQRDAAIAAALAGFYDSTQTDAAITAALVPYSTTAQMNQAITDALVPFETAAQRDTAIAAALAGFSDSTQTDAAITAALVPYGTAAERDTAIAAALASVTLSNGQSWNGGPTFNLLRASNVLRNLSDGRRPDRQLPEPGRHDPHRVGQLRPQRNLHPSGDGHSDHRRHRCVGPVPIPKRSGGPGPHRRGPGALLGPNGGLDLRDGRVGQLRHQQLGDLGHLLGPVQLRQQLPGRFQDHHGSAGLLHAGRSRSADHKRPRERGSEQLLHLGPDRFAVLPPHRAGFAADSDPHPVLDVGANPNGDRRRHRRRGLPDPSAGGHALLRGQRQRELRVPGAHQRHSPHDQGPPAPGAPGGLHHPHGNHARAHLRRLFQVGVRRAVPEQQQLRAARRQVLCEEPCGGRGQRPLPPRPRAVHAPLHKKPALPALTGGAILGNGSVIEIEADCWTKAQSDSRYPLVATFNSLGSTVTSIDGRVSTLETDVGAIDGRVTALENSGGVAPTADLTVNSLTATTFMETPQLQSAAGDLQIQNALVTVRKEDGALWPASPTEASAWTGT